MRYLLYMMLGCVSFNKVHSQNNCKNKIISEKYGNGYRTLSSSYFKDCKLSFQEEYYYDEKEVLFRKVIINYRKFGTRKLYLETYNSDVVNEKRYDKLGNVIFERITIYNIKGNVTEIRTTRNGNTTTRKFPVDIYGEPL